MIDWRRKKVHEICTRTFGIQVNRASVFFKTLSEMVHKKSYIGSAVQIRKIMKDAGFCFATEHIGTTVTMIDAENVTAL